MQLPLKIFAVDPATTISGWSLLEVQSLTPLRIKVVRHGKLDGQKLLTKNKDLTKLFQRQFCVLDALEQEYIALLEELTPDIVVSESAYGYSHMSALIALTLAINTLRRASKVVLNKDIILIPPTISKLSFTGHGGADKDRMRAAFMTVPFLIHDITSADQISEHEIDSVAHCCGYVRRDLVGDVVQISALEKKRQKREKQKLKDLKNKTDDG